MMTDTIRVADEAVQDAVMNLMLWTSSGSDDYDGPLDRAPARARDCKAEVDFEAWWNFIFKTRRWLESPDDVGVEDDDLQNPFVLPSRVADHATQQAIIDLISWSTAAVRLFGRGPDESAQNSIELIRTWLGLPTS